MTFDGNSCSVSKLTVLLAGKSLHKKKGKNAKNEKTLQSKRQFMQIRRKKLQATSSTFTNCQFACHLQICLSKSKYLHTFAAISLLCASICKLSFHICRNAFALLLSFCPCVLIYLPMSGNIL